MLGLRSTFGTPPYRVSSTWLAGIGFFGVVGAVVGLRHPAAAQSIGPSFSCSPAPVDALAQLTCANPTLSFADIKLVQAYYALRHTVGVSGQRPLKSEFLSFIVNTRRACGLPPVDPGRDQSSFPVLPGAASCVVGAYEGQRTAWAHRLTGPAADEAARAPDRNVALQAKLQVLGYLPSGSTADGVFGTATRNAVVAWQAAKGRPVTSFLDDADAAMLFADQASSSRQASATASATTTAPDRTVKALAIGAMTGASLQVAYKDLTVEVRSGSDQELSVCKAGGLLGLSAEPPAGQSTCRGLIVVVSVGGKQVIESPLAAIAEGQGIGGLNISVAIRQLDRASAYPQVVLSGYTGGAHCCTVTVVATSASDETWQFVDLGRNDGDGGIDVLTLDDDGSSVLVDYNDRFLYQYGSYVGSLRPTRLRKLSGTKVADVTREPRYRSYLLRELKLMEQRGASERPLREPNAYFAGWVSQKALVGQLSEAWRTMLASYDRKEEQGRNVCAVDESIFFKTTYGTRECPKGEEIQVSYPEALARLLTELGYITPQESALLGFDPVKSAAQREQATVRYKEQMISGWFIISRDGNCVLARSPMSPADMIRADRYRGIEDNVSVVDGDAKGKPVAVRVDQPRANGLVSALTFYRGAARCESSRAQQQQTLEQLRYAEPRS